VIAHTQQPTGGIDPTTGQTTDSAFDLITDPWVSRFRLAALWKPFQQVQVQTALSDFRGSLALIEQYAPQLNSERAVGFMLDLANRFGNAVFMRRLSRMAWRFPMFCKPWRMNRCNAYRIPGKPERKHAASIS
jgi:hypothetical protein